MNRDESAVSRPLVAVFGPNKATDDEREAARSFGRAIAREGAIVLTGGEWRARPAEIKDIAIAAAERCSSASAHTPVWIGVANETLPAPWEESHRGGIVTPGGNHERNFVEACLCHAAIVIGTGNGTASEALFALYLNRPVAMVTAGDPRQRDTTMQTLRTAAGKRITPTDLEDPVRRGIRLAFSWSETTDMRLAYRALPKSDDEAGAIVREVLRAVGRADPRPAWRTLDDAGAWAAFVEQSLTAAA